MTMVQTRSLPGTQDLSDEELVDRIRKRDEWALREVVAQHGPLVLNVARKTLQDAARAEEVAQDTFVALWSRPEAFDRQRGSLRSFLLGIAHHKSVDEVRKQSSRDRATGRLMDGVLPSIESGWTYEAETGPDIRRAFKTLSPKLKETMFLAFYVGLTYREVARELRIPEGTAKSRIRDALQHLRSHLLSVHLEPS